MKKMLLFALIPLFFLFSCRDGGRSPLYYQQSAAEASGTLYTDTGDFYVTVTLAPYDGTGHVRDGEIVYSYPEEMAGYKVSVSGGNVTLSAEGLTVPLAGGAALRYLDVIKLFTLDENSLYSAERSDNGELLCSFGCYGGVLVTVDPETSLPVRICKSDGSIDFKMDNYSIDEAGADESTGPVGTKK